MTRFNFDHTHSHGAFLLFDQPKISRSNFGAKIDYNIRHIVWIAAARLQRTSHAVRAT